MLKKQIRKTSELTQSRLNLRPSQQLIKLANQYIIQFEKNQERKQMTKEKNKGKHS